MDTLQNIPGLGNVHDIDGTTGRDWAQFLGGTRCFENVYRDGMSSRPRKKIDGAWIHAVLLKNASGGTLLGGNLARLDVSGTAGGGENYLYTQVAGYGNDNRLRTVVLIDPWIPTAGVANGKAFWGIFRGPAPGRTPQLLATFLAAVAVGDPVYCTADALGRISGGAAPASDAEALAYAIGKLGTAMNNAATSDVNTQVDVHWEIPLFG